MTVSLAPPMVLQFQNPNNSGSPAAGFKLFTYQAGTSTKQSTWTDSTQTTQLPNPIILDSQGAATVWGDQSLVYKFVLASPTDTDPPTSPLRTVDNIYFPLTANTGLLPSYPKTSLETTAGVTVVNAIYPPGRVDRYGTNSQPGISDMTQAFQFAINQARLGGADVVWGDTGVYALYTTLDCTNTNYGITFRQILPRGTNLPPPQGSIQIGGIWVKHNGYAVFDLAGCIYANFYDISLVTQDPPNPGTPVAGIYPKTCFFLSRTTFNAGSNARFHNTTVTGCFSVAILYNYGSEIGVYSDNDWQNEAPDTGSCCVVVTASNLFKTNTNFITSSFATVVTGTQSTLSHEFCGGSYGMQNMSSTSDIFYVEGGVDQLRLLEFWCVASNANGSTNGRSFVYNDTTNGGANRLHIHGVHLENSTTQPAYFIDVAAGTGAVNFWSIIDSYCKTATHDILIDSSILCAGWRVVNLSNASGTPGMSATGTVQDSWLDWPVNITIGTSNRNVFRNTLANVTRSSHSADWFFDHSGVLYLDASLAMNGAAAPGQSTGWGSPVGGAVVNNYNITDAGGASSNTNKAVAQIIVVLKNLGLFGA